MTHQEFRIFGPPGTGKTTYIAKQVGVALRKYHPDQIVCASFTRAAALELGGREEKHTTRSMWAIPDGFVRVDAEPDAPF